MRCERTGLEKLLRTYFLFRNIKATPTSPIIAAEDGSGTGILNLESASRGGTSLSSGAFAIAIVAEAAKATMVHDPMGIGAFRVMCSCVCASLGNLNDPHKLKAN